MYVFGVSELLVTQSLDKIDFIQWLFTHFPIIIYLNE